MMRLGLEWRIRSIKRNMDQTPLNRDFVYLENLSSRDKLCPHGRLKYVTYGEQY